ncbi:MAG: tetratricopeptide repeat protein [Sedimentisphaerales bacterium]|nr:tetratricopeptide repeat protein [Sedimentisphaerales bacterium]
MRKVSLRVLLIASPVILAIAGMCTVLVKWPLRKPALDRDIFIVSGPVSALPDQQDPASLAQTLLADMPSVQDCLAIVIDYPFEGSVFPPEIVAPTFLWHDQAEAADLWLVDVSFDTVRHHIYAFTAGALPERRIDHEAVSSANENYKPGDYALSARAWTPDEPTWELIKANSTKSRATVTIIGIETPNPKAVSRTAVEISTSGDPVGAPIFYRDVPLMPAATVKGQIKPLAKGALPLISWRLRDISKHSAPVVLKDMPTCGNCHSFSQDGSLLAMDMDGPQGDKGAYAITRIEKDIVITADDIITWSAYDGAIKGQKTFGLFSQVSPDGRYVVSTLNESVFVSNYSDFRFLQSFYPTRGILVVYDRNTRQMKSLGGADDTAYVHANGCWSPDGRELVFSRAQAKDKYEAPVMPTHVGDANETFIQYDLYKIPFNDGKGGSPKPLKGASANGFSNSFARYSPDGKWIVFVQAEKGQLMRPDSKLYIIPSQGGKARLMNCNLPVMNSWHSFSPNGRWLVFASKGFRPFTQMFLTHIDEQGHDTPPILVPNSTADNRAVNIPEFLNNSGDAITSISTPTQESYRHFKKSQELRKTGRYTEALAELDRSLELNNLYAKAHNDKGFILFKAGKLDEARACFERAIELDDEYGMACSNLGSVLQTMGKLDEAADKYEQALKLNPGLLDAHINYARILKTKGNLDDAIIHYRYAVAIQPNLPDVYCDLGTAQQQKGTVDEAISSYRKALEADPNYARAHHGLGIAMAHAGDLDGATEQLSRCIDLAPENPSVHFDLARVFARQGEFESSARHFSQALRLKPDYTPARLGLAEALFGQGLLSESAAQCRDVLAAQSENIAALNLLAWILSTGDNDTANPVQAVELAEKACRLTERKAPQLLDTLAAAYARADRFPEAIASAREALDLADNAGNKDLAKMIQGRLELYNQSKNYTLPSRSEQK